MMKFLEVQLNISNKHNYQGLFQHNLILTDLRFTEKEQGVLLLAGALPLSIYNYLKFKKKKKKNWGLG